MRRSATITLLALALTLTACTPGLHVPVGSLPDHRDLIPAPKRSTPDIARPGPIRPLPPYAGPPLVVPEPVMEPIPYQPHATTEGD